MTTGTIQPGEITRGRVFELVAIVVTAAGKFILGDWLGRGLYYIVLACVFWIAYVALISQSYPDVRARWGFTRHGTTEGAKLIAPVAAVTLGGFIVFGLGSGRADPSWNTLIMLLVYPVWGTIQQFMVVALLADNARALSRGRLPVWAVSLLGATLFALIHLPVYPLVVATFVLGLVTTNVFFRTRSIWLPGFFHGWYATVFYSFVLGQDPLGSLVNTAFGL